MFFVDLHIYIYCFELVGWCMLLVSLVWVCFGLVFDLFCFGLFFLSKCFADMVLGLFFVTVTLRFALLFFCFALWF